MRLWLTLKQSLQSVKSLLLRIKKRFSSAIYGTVSTSTFKLKAIICSLSSLDIIDTNSNDYKQKTNTGKTQNLKSSFCASGVEANKISASR